MRGVNDLLAWLWRGRLADEVAVCSRRLLWDAGTGGRPGALDGRLFSYRHDLKGHTGAVYAVQFSPCGRYVATGSFDKSVRIWDATAPTEVHSHGPPRRSRMAHDHAKVVLRLVWCA